MFPNLIEHSLHIHPHLPTMPHLALIKKQNKIMIKIMQRCLCSLVTYSWNHVLTIIMDKNKRQSKHHAEPTIDDKTENKIHTIHLTETLQGRAKEKVSFTPSLN